MNFRRVSYIIAAAIKRYPLTIGLLLGDVSLPELGKLDKTYAIVEYEPPNFRFSVKTCSLYSPSHQQKQKNCIYN